MCSPSFPKLNFSLKFLYLPFFLSFVFTFETIAQSTCTTFASCINTCCSNATDLECGKICGGICSSFPQNCSNLNGVDYEVWRPETGLWYKLSKQAITELKSFGAQGDFPLIGNYAAVIYGDQNPSLLRTIWRPSTGNWSTCFFSNSQVDSCNSNDLFQFGLPGDYPVNGDIDGVGFDDLIVWRPAFGQWYYTLSSDGSFKTLQWGLPGDFPFVGDFDGDQKGDLAVWRNSSGTWYILLSSQGYDRSSNSNLVVNWGLSGDYPLIGDRDGDGRDDLTVWRSEVGFWFICHSLDNFSCLNPAVKFFGLPGDVPIQKDFDEDGIFDYAVWSPLYSFWVHENSSDGRVLGKVFGNSKDIPLNLNIRDAVSYLYGPS